MADKSLKGRGLGSRSLADTSGVELAGRRDVAFECTSGHTFIRTFSDEAELPDTWECPRCSGLATRVGVDTPARKAIKPTRTHWDMLRERRSIAELEEILAERLDEIRKGA